MDVNEHLLRQLNQGPLKASAGSDGKLRIQVAFPTDEGGFTERGCASADCEPRLFKIRGAMPEGRDRRCPYCGALGDSNSFATEDQVRYAREKLSREAHEAMSDAFHQIMHDGLGLDSQGRRRIGSGMFSMELTVTRKRDTQPEVPLPKSERPRRDVKCPDCGLDHVVFGLATWCHGCGSDVFGAHVRAEVRDIGALLQDCVARRQHIGERLFARQAENVLEDLVSAWEAGLRYLLQRHLRAQGKTVAETDAFLQKTIRNQLQNLDRATEILRDHLHVDVFSNVDAHDLAKATTLFAARHTVTHRLGVTDPKFVAQVGAGHVGREVDLDPSDLQWLATFLEARLLRAWSAVFPREDGPASSEKTP